MNSLVVVWQDPKTRSWLPIGVLSQRDRGFAFYYTRGAMKSPNFLPFSRMHDLRRTYYSAELFPVFANRVMARSRPEYSQFLDWLGLTKDSPLHILARSEGVRATDQLQLYPIVEPTHRNEYEMYFFSHGIRHLSAAAATRIESLKVGDTLFPLLDIQNPIDRYAIALRSDDPVSLVGYAPSFLVQDFRKVLRGSGAIQGSVTVEKINRDAPIQFRLLCKIVVPWPKRFRPFSSANFRPLSSETASTWPAAVAV